MKAHWVYAVWNQGRKPALPIAPKINRIRADEAVTGKKSRLPMLLIGRPVPILGHKNVCGPLLSKYRVAQNPIGVRVTACHGNICLVAPACVQKSSRERQFLIHILI